ncbi:MAG: DHH family phosphoesterase, partial [Pseudomonadota bacterium]
MSAALLQPIATLDNGATGAFVALPSMGAPASGRRWVMREADPRATLSVAQETGVDIVVARALAARGVDKESAPAYLNPSLRDALPDPNTLADMEAAVDRVARAVIDGEGIGVFGDYDVDGVTASSILHLYLRALGVTAPVYLPDRIAEGYGPSADAFRSLKADGAKVVVTVDCGAASHEAIAAAAAEAIDVVVVDHHQMSAPPPEGAVAVVNPNRPDDVSGLNGLSAAGVAFMLIVGLN